MKLKILVKSLHPAHSRKLSERFLRKTFMFYFTCVAVGLFLMLGIFIGLNAGDSSDSIVVNQSTILVERPLVTLEHQINESRFISFSNDEARYPFLGTWTYTNQLTMLLLPGVVLLIGVISVGMGIFLALLSSLIAFFASKKSAYRDLLVINLHYQAPVIALFFILYPFWKWSFLICIVYLFNFVFGALLLQGKKFKSIDI